MDKEPGTLFIVGLPIGNPDDLSPRAQSILNSVKRIACEDTRVTGLLLRPLNINTPFISYHDHNKTTKTPAIIEYLRQGEDIALVSDAGMPTIADPGYNLVRTATRGGYQVKSVPGPCAATAALAISGLPSDRFLFAGFLPRKPAARQKYLAEFKNLSITMIFYLSPHRLGLELNDLKTVFGDRQCCLGRELTKRYEETLYCNLSEAIIHFEKRKPKGEFTIVLSGLEE